MNGTEPPEGWPEMYGAAGRGPGCPHQMHWNGKGYECIYGCGEFDKEPPESKVES
jgi:hypothetical protein